MPPSRSRRRAAAQPLGASAVYGSDAVTGVINFILKDDLDGLHLDARQNITERGDGRVSSADLSYGTKFLGGRGKLVASVGWLDQDPVLYDARRFSTRALTNGCAVPGTRSPFGDSTAVDDPDCAAPNEISLVAGGSFSIPGSLISNSAFFPVPGSTALVRNPDGLRFDPDGTPRPFSIATDRYNFAPANYLQIGFRRLSANMLASLEISPEFTPYTELAYIETRSPQQFAPLPAFLGVGFGRPALRINLDNPFLTAEASRVLDLSHGIDAEGDRGVVRSAAGDFSVNPAFGGDADGIVEPFALESRLDLGPRRIVNRREAIRGLLGARGDIAKDWSYDLYFSHSRVEHRAPLLNSGSALRLQQAMLAVRDLATGEIVCSDRSNGCAPANIFGAGNLSEAAADFIRTDPVNLTTVEEQVGEASVRGELPLLPAGPSGIVLGVSWRRSSYEYTPDPSLFTGDDLGLEAGAPAAGSTKVWELFAEARVPLLAGRRFADELSTELGLRYSNYDTVGGVWTWKALADWTPVKDLRLRGGYQRAVRAPNVRELFEEESPGGEFFLDPCSALSGLLDAPAIAAACVRDGVPPQLLGENFPAGGAFALFRGNPDLKAEIARTLTVGLVATPRWLPGLSATLDYYDIRIRNAIGRFGGGGIFIVNGCIQRGADPADPLCAAYERDPEGFVFFIEQPTANLPEIRARGIDWQLAWQRRLQLLGDSDRIALNLSGTHYFESSFRPNRGVSSFDCAGVFGDPCGNTLSATATPKWKLYNRLAFTTGPATLTLRHRWFSSTLEAPIEGSRVIGFIPPRLPEEGRKLESRHYFDLAATLRAGERFELTLGINNLTDRKPAITGTRQVQANTDPSLYDVLGRRFFVALSVGGL